MLITKEVQMKLIPDKWNELQQYKDRKPIWIKLHRELLNNFSYSSVQIGTKATLPLLWLLACEYEDGIIDATLEEIAFRIHIDKKTIGKAIDELVECRFFELVQDCTVPYSSVLREEKRRDREETEKETEKETAIVQIVQIDNPLINQQSLNEWLDYKKYKSKAAITKTKNFLSKYSFDIQQQIVDTSIMNNYKGLFEPKLSKTSNNIQVAQDWINKNNDSIFDTEVIENVK